MLGIYTGVYVQNMYIDIKMCFKFFSFTAKFEQIWVELFFSLFIFSLQVK